MKVVGIVALVVLVAAAVGFEVKRIIEAKGPLGTAEAREAIEGMPYPVDVEEKPDHVLVGEVRGRGDLTIHFAAAKSLTGAGIPPRLRRLDSEPLGGGNFWIWDDSVREAERGSKRQWDEAVKIEVGMEEALCRKETGEACPI